MKKIISTVAALAVVAAMGATALAADLPSPTTTADITATPVSLNPDYYGVEVNAIDFDIPGWVLADLTDEVSSTAGDAEVAAIDLCTVEITIKETGEDFYWYVDENNPVTLAFAFDDAENVIAVLEWDPFNGEWIEADFEIVDGEVVATLTQGYILSFVTQAVKADEPSKDDGKGSAQTGYSAVVYIASAVALAAGAAFFFATSGKKTAKDAK